TSCGARGSWPSSARPRAPGEPGPRPWRFSLALSVPPAARLHAGANGLAPRAWEQRGRRGESNPGRRGVEVIHGSRNRATISSGYPRSTRQVPSFGHRVPKTSALDLHGATAWAVQAKPSIMRDVAGGLKGSAKGGFVTPCWRGRRASACPKIKISRLV